MREGRFTGEGLLTGDGSFIRDVSFAGEGLLVGEGRFTGDSRLTGDGSFAGEGFLGEGRFTGDSRLTGEGFLGEGRFIGEGFLGEGRLIGDGFLGEGFLGGEGGRLIGEGFLGGEGGRLIGDGFLGEGFLGGEGGRFMGEGVLEPVHLLIKLISSLFLRVEYPLHPSFLANCFNLVTVSSFKFLGERRSLEPVGEICFLFLQSIINLIRDFLPSFEYPLHPSFLASFLMLIIFIVDRDCGDMLELDDSLCPSLHLAINLSNETLVSFE
jgi:hypothetical protein